MPEKAGLRTGVRREQSEMRSTRLLKNYGFSATTLPSRQKLDLTEGNRENEGED